MHGAYNIILAHLSAFVYCNFFRQTASKKHTGGILIKYGDKNMKQKNGKELPRALSMAFLCDPKAFTRFLAMDERAQSAVVIRAQDMESGNALQAFVHRIGQ